MNVRSIAVVLLLAFTSPGPRESGFERAVASAEAALSEARLDDARTSVREALERDGKSFLAWELEARRAEAAAEPDRRIHALHRAYGLSLAQDRDEEEVSALHARLLGLDPLAEKLFGFRARHLKKLLPLAERYEQLGWRHAAVQVHKEILALDPVRTESEEAIQKLASAPDPSLAEDAKPADLLAGISQAWLHEHDAKHATWKKRAKLERENYFTETDAGYAVLVRAAEAMEQMNAFYRTFFEYGSEDDGRSVPRIKLLIFKNKEEYLKHGSSPVEWSGGQFTGGTVETFVGDVPFEAMIGTLFHEAAHQFVSLATSAAGWMNEGLASFFEGTRMLSNGTVIMNLPANGRLFPLVTRMEQGFMADAMEGLDPNDPNVEPEKAPTFRLVLENEYTWGPAWYGPTWGVVYFLYNYQDPADGRFVYRNAFHEYVNKSGGRVGKSAVKAFEETVLANPEPPTTGVRNSVQLPETVDELNGLWQEWLVALRDEQSGRRETDRPFGEWARRAVERGDVGAALEHFEKGLRATPDDPELLFAFGGFLTDQKKKDRAAKLLRKALILLEAEADGDDALLAEVETQLQAIDPQLEKLRRVREDLVAEATELVDGYLEAELERMAMEVALGLGTQFSIPALFERYESAVRREGGSNARWRLAYDGESLRGWNASGSEIFSSRGGEIEADVGDFESGVFDYRFLTLDEVTSGDFSIEAEVQARNGEVAFAGLVFGQKSSEDFHALVLFPPSLDRKANLDLASFYGGGGHKTWRHNPVEGHPDEAESWYHLRVDVTGSIADAWVDGRRIATQEFPSVDVLRGSFGLFTGVGQSRFRNVRYLARNPNDPSAKIEREVLSENEEAASRGATGRAASRDGSWIGLELPFPSVSEWIQDRPRSGWKDGLGGPQLLVLWSVQQNDAVEINRWLQSLAKRYEPVGLRILNVGLCWDRDLVRDYVKEHAFPGSIGIDSVMPNGLGGQTFDDYSIDRFFLPRIVLVDVDGRAVWEGDPGFSAGRPWKGEESFLDGPLQDLIANRQLDKIIGWRERWAKEGEPALEAGEMHQAIPLLLEAGAFDPELFPDVGRALKSLRTLETAISDVDALCARLSEAEAEPAFEALTAWAELLGTPVIATKVTKKLPKAASMKDWKRALGMLKSMRRKIDSGKEAGATDGVLERMEPLIGALPARLRTELRAAGEDPEEIKAVVLGAEELPALWLAESIFEE